MQIVICSGYFNPIHKGHIEYLEKAMMLGSKMVVIVNNDEQVKVKGSKSFMNLEERMKIVSSIKGVDKVIASIDRDETVCKTIEKIFEYETYQQSENMNFVFAKGGDRKSDNIPEKETCYKLGVKIVDGLGEKIQSSSELLSKIK